MRIPIQLLPDLDKTIGQLRTMDCFACVWQAFSGCSDEERAEMTSALKYGLQYKKVIEILEDLYPYISWDWVSIHEAFLPKNYAAIVFYSSITLDKPPHYSILKNTNGELTLFDTQIKTEEPLLNIDMYETFLVLDGYHIQSGSIIKHRLPEESISYKHLSENPTYQGEINKLFYEMEIYIKKLNELFINEKNLEEDIQEFNKIGKKINEINNWALTNNRDKKLRRYLNYLYRQNYKTLNHSRNIDFVHIENPLHVKSTNFSNPKRSKQKPTKSKFKRSKLNSARTRKSKRKSKKRISFNRSRNRSISINEY